jgi:membrane protein YqaA with SNARE-associated domain
MTKLASVVKLWQKRWFRAAVYGVVLVGLSIGLAYLMGQLFARFNISQAEFAPLACLIVFGSTLVMNTTIIVPVPIATAIMMAAALQWNPVLISLAASIGGSLGELSGYYAGLLGKKVIAAESIVGYERVATWMDRYGPLTIFLLAFIPFMPFDIGGMIAGGARMPMWKFLLPCWVGKFPKYILLCYAAKFGIQFLPSCSF